MTVGAEGSFDEIVRTVTEAEFTKYENGHFTLTCEFEGRSLIFTASSFEGLINLSISVIRNTCVRTKCSHCSWIGTVDGKDAAIDTYHVGELPTEKCNIA